MQGLNRKAAKLTIVACTITNNTAEGGGAGIENNGILDDGAALDMYDCYVVGNTGTSASIGGGGVGNDFGATARIHRSTFKGNSTRDRGGAIDNWGTLELYECTLIGNSAGDWGGGIHNYAESLADLRSCTIVNNQGSIAGGGLHMISGAMVAMRNTIVAGNSASGQDYGMDCGGHVVSGDYNLIQNTNGSTILGTTGHNIYGQSPKLGSLAFNGGPTPTLTLLSDSPARDAGDDALSGTDQRRRPRRSGSHVDIGAFEYQVAVPQLLIDIRIQTNGLFYFSVPNPSDMTMSVLATTNATLPVGQWLNLGPPVPVAEGLFQFTDPEVAIYHQRFYQVHWQ